MAAAVYTINLEQGMPTVEEARERLNQELRKAKSSGAKVAKIIHGYGSTGKGGKIKPAVHHALAIHRREHAIRAYTPGENWDIFDETSRMILDYCPEMRKDPALGRSNLGITIVLL